MPKLNRLIKWIQIYLLFIISKISYKIYHTEETLDWKKTKQKKLYWLRENSDPQIAKQTSLASTLMDTFTHVDEYLKLMSGFQ